MRGPSDKAVEKALLHLPVPHDVHEADMRLALQAAYPHIITEVVEWLREYPHPVAEGLTLQQVADAIEREFGGER